MKLHQHLEAAGAYQKLTQLDKKRRLKNPPRRTTLLQTYLTTELTQGELAPLVGLGAGSSVQYHLLTSLRDVLPVLPEPVRQEYGTPEQAIRVKSGKQTEATADDDKCGH